MEPAVSAPAQKRLPLAAKHAGDLLGAAALLSSALSTIDGPHRLGGMLIAIAAGLCSGALFVLTALQVRHGELPRLALTAELCGALLSLVEGFQKLAQGKHYLPYAYFVAFLALCAAALVQHRRRHR